MLRPIGCHVHAIEFFDEIAFPKEGANNSQTAPLRARKNKKIRNSLFTILKKEFLTILYILFRMRFIISPC